MTTNTFARSDTLLGICEALGEDLHFNPLWLRLALTAGMLWSPAAMIGGYLTAGIIVALVRRLSPAPVGTASLVTAAPAPAPVALNDEVPLPLAA